MPAPWWTLTLEWPTLAMHTYSKLIHNMVHCSEPPTSNTLNQYKFQNFSTFQYFSENLAYYAPIMLILKPKLQYFSSTSTEESVQLEALIAWYSNVNIKSCWRRTLPIIQVGFAGVWIQWNGNSGRNGGMGEIDFSSILFACLSTSY